MMSSNERDDLKALWSVGFGSLADVCRINAGNFSRDLYPIHFEEVALNI
jgi:hypothetical protein